MGCNCINETRNKMKEMFPEAEEIDYQNVEILSKRVYSTIKIKMRNKKKLKEILLRLSYCPHCGKKYEEETK